MINSRFYKRSGPYKLSEIIKLISAEILPVTDGYEDILIHDIKPLEEALSGDLSFLTNKKYITEFHNTKASSCIVPENFLAKAGPISLTMSPIQMKCLNASLSSSASSRLNRREVAISARSF